MMKTLAAWFPGQGPVFRFQPERSLLGLQRFLHHAQQLRLQRVQAGFILRCFRELGQHLLGVVLFAEEAGVDASLQTRAQRGKQRGDDERGNDDDGGGLIPWAAVRRRRPGTGRWIMMPVLPRMALSPQGIISVDWELISDCGLSECGRWSIPGPLG